MSRSSVISKFKKSDPPLSYTNVDALTSSSSSSIQPKVLISSPSTNDISHISVSPRSSTIKRKQSTSSSSLSPMSGTSSCEDKNDDHMNVVSSNDDTTLSHDGNKNGLSKKRSNSFTKMIKTQVTSLVLTNIHKNKSSSNSGSPLPSPKSPSFKSTNSNSYRECDIDTIKEEDERRINNGSSSVSSTIKIEEKVVTEKEPLLAENIHYNGGILNRLNTDISTISFCFMCENEYDTTILIKRIEITGIRFDKSIFREIYVCRMCSDKIDNQTNDVPFSINFVLTSVNIVNISHKARMCYYECIEPSVKTSNNALL